MKFSASKMTQRTRQAISNAVGKISQRHCQTLRFLSRDRKHQQTEVRLRNLNVWHAMLR